MIAGWSVALGCREDRLGIAYHWTVWPLLLFSLASGLAVVGALNQATAVHFAVRSIGLAALFLYFNRALSTRRLSPAAAAGWLLPGMALNGLLAIAQAVHQNPLGLTWLGEPRMLRSVFGTAVVQVQGKPLLRAYGVLPHPNVLGGLLAAALPLAAGLLMRAEARDDATVARRPRSIRPTLDALLLLCIALMLAGIFLSYSRSAWLGLLIGVAYLLQAPVSCPRHRHVRPVDKARSADGYGRFRGGNGSGCNGA